MQITGESWDFGLLQIRLPIHTERELLCSDSGQITVFLREDLPNRPGMFVVFLVAHRRELPSNAVAHRSMYARQFRAQFEKLRKPEKEEMFFGNKLRWRDRTGTVINAQLVLEPPNSLNGDTVNPFFDLPPYEANENQHQAKLNTSKQSFYITKKHVVTMILKSSGPATVVSWRTPKKMQQSGDGNILGCSVLGCKTDLEVRFGD